MSMRERARTSSKKQKFQGSDRGRFSKKKSLLFGVHACLAALLNPKRQGHQLWVTLKTFSTFSSEVQRQIKNVCTPVFVEGMAIQERVNPSDVHQGILLEVDPLEEVSLEELVALSGKEAMIVLLDQVTDPHNVGAILRSAAAFGIHGIVMPHHHSVDNTATLAKCASGALEQVPLVSIGNLKQALDYLKLQGFWCMGLDEEGAEDVRSFRFEGKIALVLGAEGQGLRRLTKETCDGLIKLPTNPHFPTLNVSNAAAITFYEIACQLTERRKSS